MLWHALTTAQLLGYTISVYSAFVYYYFQEVKSNHDFNLLDVPKRGLTPPPPPHHVDSVI